jgi:peptidoglycan/xylan/chitin deacetylase (PgdA/CDA1 family)
MAITYDDSTLNQFRIALPLMNERGLVSTFFVVTGETPGSRFPPTFVGRPIMEVLRESATVPTTRENVFERASVIRYLADIERVEEAWQPTGMGGFNPRAAIQAGNYDTIDAALARLRATGVTYAAGRKPWVAVRSQEQGRPLASQPGGLSWNEFRLAAAQGHEFANHGISHPQLPVLDAANILYEVDSARQDLREQLGDKHTFSIEAPYGIDDDRVKDLLINRFPLTRNWVAASDDFMDGIMRPDQRDPATSTKPYVQWQRGPGPRTPMADMTGWVDKSIATGTWLVLVIHGVEGLGSSAMPADTLRTYFDYIAARVQEGRLWVATFQDGAKYVRERMRSTIKTRPAGPAIEVTVSHALDPKMYDLPLTARTTVPAQWTSVHFRQGPVTLTLPVQHQSDSAYVQYRIAPNGVVARLERGP